MPTTKITKGSNGNRYSNKQMIEALTVLRKSGGNLQQTMNITGVCRMTLKKWATQHPEYLQLEPSATTVSRVTSLVAQREESVLTKYYANQTAILDMAYDKLKELIPECKRIPEIMEVVKVFKPEAVPAESENMNSESVVEETVKRLCYIRKAINKE